MDHRWHLAYGESPLPWPFRINAGTREAIRRAADSGRHPCNSQRIKAVKPRVVRCALLALLSVAAGQAQAIAQTWPDKPITFIVPFAAGGGTAAFARPLPAPLAPPFGKRALVE